MSDINNLNHKESLLRTGFWGETGAGVIMFSKATKRFMLGYRSSEVLEPNTYGTIGGAVDMGETIQESIEREILEELEFSGKFELKTLFVFKSGTFSYHNCIAIVNDEFEPVLNWENDGHKWFTLDEIRKCDNLHFGINSILDDESSMEILSDLIL